MLFQLNKVEKLGKAKKYGDIIHIQFFISRIRNVNMVHSIFQSTKEENQICMLSNKYFLSSLEHSGILGFMTLLLIENEKILVFQKSKWIIKQKLISHIGFFLKLFSQLILTTGSLNTGPDIAVYYGLWACVSTKRPAALFSVIAHTS